MKYLLILILTLSAATSAQAVISSGAVLAAVAANNSATRSRATVYKFRSAHPCPANKSLHGACPGWIVDHVIALCVGGLDTPSNMQWQTVAAAKAKDKVECKRQK